MDFFFFFLTSLCNQPKIPVPLGTGIFYRQKRTALEDFQRRS